MIDESELRAHGLYDPAAPNAADRLAMLRFLEAEGVTLADMVAASPAGRLLSLAGDRLVVPGTPTYSLRDFAGELGIAPATLAQIHRAAGFAPVADTDPIFTAADAVIYRGFLAGARLLGERPLLDLARVLGSALARVAETAIALFIVHVEDPLTSGGAGELAIARANRDAQASLSILIPVLEPLFRRHMQDAIRRQRQSRDPSGEPGIVRLAIGFVDLVGFTPMARSMDTAALAETVRTFEARAHDIVTARDGRVVKHIGDEVMFVALDAARACDIALSLVETFRDEPSGVMPRGGVAAGQVLMRGGDYYGTTVNFASRIADLAVPFEILVAPEVPAEASGFRFEPAGRRLLKGFAEPVQLYAATR